MIVPLKRAYPSRYGVPTITQIDPEMFTRTYFHECMACTFCHDSCCQYGAAVDVPNIERIMAAADQLEPYVGVDRARWFKDELRTFSEYPSGHHRRTQVIDGRCAFINRDGRGCLIHKYSLETGMDVHELKPFVCCLFPLDFEDSTLFPALEVVDGTLQCLGAGLTCYRSSRQEVAYYFGEELVAELDELEAVYLPSDSRTVALPIVQG